MATLRNNNNLKNSNMITTINNINGFDTAKSICEAATGMPFKHFTNSICKIDFTALNQ